MWVMTSVGCVGRHPLFVQTRSGHGRVEVRALHAFAMEPMKADFPFARSLIVVRSQRTIKTGHTSMESRYYLSSALPGDHCPESWLKLIGGHWRARPGAQSLAARRRDGRGRFPQP